MGKRKKLCSRPGQGDPTYVVGDGVTGRAFQEQPGKVDPVLGKM